MKTKKENGLYTPGSCAIRDEIPLAPVSSHTFLSSSACVTAIAMFRAIPSKTQRFRCFHNVQAPIMIKEFRPFLNGPRSRSLVLFHHYMKDMLPVGGGKLLELYLLEKSKPELSWKNTRVINGQCSPLPGHKGGISWDEPCLLMLDGQQSSTYYVPPATQRT
jgi:hypothetical protein